MAFFLLAACSSGKQVPTAAPPDARVEASPPPAASAKAGSAAPTKAAPDDPDVEAELIVGSERGLEAWRRDGSGKRLISKGSALYPRWLDRATGNEDRQRDRGRFRHPIIMRQEHPSA
jgi:hypothetical protein